MIPTEVRRRIMTTLFAAQSLFSAAQIASFTLLPIIAADLGGSASVAGIPATIALLGRALAAYPMGWLMGRSGRRVGLSLGYLIGGAGSLVSAFGVGAGSFLWFTMGSGLSGMARGSSDQARFAAADVQVKERRAKAIGLIVFASTIGAILGPALVVPASSLAANYGLNPDSGPYLIAGLLTYFAMLLSFMFLRPDPMLIGQQIEDAEAVANPRTEPASNRSLREIAGRPQVRLAVLALVIGQLVMTLLMVITPLHMDYLEQSRSDVSWVIMAHTLGMFGLASVTGFLVDRAGRVAMILAGSMLLVLAGVLAPVAQSVPLLALALFLLGLGWNFSFIAGSSLLSDALSTPERGRVQGASDTVVSLASGAGSLSTGVIYSLGGMAAVGGLGIAFALILAASALWYARGASEAAPAR